MHTRTQPTRRGFVMLDALTGLAIVGIIAAGMGMCVGQQHRIARQMAHERAAMRIAEQVMDDLQTGREPTLMVADTTLQMRLVDNSGPGERIWIEVRVTHAERSASLIGLVPAGAERYVQPPRFVMEVGP